jgi:hypothetical protein
MSDSWEANSDYCFPECSHNERTGLWPLKFLKHRSHSPSGQALPLYDSSLICAVYTWICTVICSCAYFTHQTLGLLWIIIYLCYFSALKKKFTTHLYIFIKVSLFWWAYHSNWNKPNLFWHLKKEYVT